VLAYLIAVMTGWTAALLVAIEIALPYLLRRTALSRALGIAPPTNARFLRRLTLHYWLGYGILGLAFAHASFLMGPAIARTSATGLLSATAALILLFLQLVLGLTLRGSLSSGRKVIKNAHFACMVALCGCTALHLMLN
jgi:hypothetical protein